MPTRSDRSPLRDAAIMPFGDHLEELRRRLILALVGIAPILVFSLLIGRQVLGLLIVPATRALADAGLDPSLQVTGPFEAFGTYMKVAFILTVLIGSPWILWQIWRFIAPGLYSHEQRFARILAPLSITLTAASALFLYYVILPVVLGFFIHFAGSIGMPAPERGVAPAPAPGEPALVFPTYPVLEADPADPPLGAAWIHRGLGELRVRVGTASDGSPRVLGRALIESSAIIQQFRVTEYVSTILSLALGFAIGFQTPVVVLLLGWIGIIEPRVMVKYRRHAIMACAVLGAVLTPADPLSMFLMMIPLVLLYELGLLLLRALPASRIAGSGAGAGGDQARPGAPGPAAPARPPAGGGERQDEEPDESAVRATDGDAR